MLGWVLRLFAVLVVVGTASAQTMLMLPRAGGSGNPAGEDPTDNDCSSASGTLTTFTAKQTGKGGNTRTNVVSISWADTTAAGTAEITGVTFNGLAAVRAVRQTSGPANNNSEVWYLANGVNGLATIDVTSSTAIDRMTIQVYRLTNFNQQTPQQLGVGEKNASISVQSGYAVVGVGSRTTNVDTNLSNLTENFSDGCGSGHWGVHSSSFPTATTTITTVISPDTNDPKIALAAWRVGAFTGDPFWNNVVFLSEFNGPNGSDTDFVESSPQQHLFDFSPTGVFNNTTSQFGSTSGRGLNSLQMGSVLDSVDWELSNSNTDQFTIEYSTYQLVSNTTQEILSTLTPPGANWTGFLVRHDTTTMVFFWGNSSGLFSLSSANAIGAGQLNTWVQWCVEKDSTGKIRLYRNGTMLASSTPANSVIGNSPSDLIFNTSGPATTTYMGNVRITKGVARYASDSGYTPATAPFPIGGP